MKMETIHTRIWQEEASPTTHSRHCPVIAKVMMSTVNC